MCVTPCLHSSVSVLSSVFHSVLFLDPTHLQFSWLQFLFLNILVFASFVVGHSDNYFLLATCFFFLLLTSGSLPTLCSRFKCCLVLVVGSCGFPFSVLSTALILGVTYSPLPPLFFSSSLKVLQNHDFFLNTFCLAFIM